MRRASAELEKRRASLGATRGLRADGTLDPYHAAILFRDSRGVSKISFKKYECRKDKSLHHFYKFNKIPKRRS